MFAPLSASRIIGGRYEISGAPIGQGGMGVVYRAYDTVTKRDVALKTLRGTVESTSLEMFSKEWTVLAKLSHPNIVDILDSGEFEDEGQRKPFFVMPLLPGVTLDALIRSASPRLTVGRVVEIMVQTCKGLQAAHERGLVHRDLKPSNIFVMDDDTVKIIDFGVVHLTDGRSVAGMKGTLPYMAPEQVDMKPATAASDIFSLGVVCYETLTGRKPFARESDIETVQALRRYIPPPASEINSAVSQLVSRVVHKAMAKQPIYRFASARDLAEALQKAIHDKPVEGFDAAKIGLRLERIRKACNDGDYQFAGEILTELEAEGHIDPEMNILRVQIEQALRQRSIRQLLDSARTRLEEEEFPHALQKIQEVLDIDPENAEARLLRAQAEERRGERQMENWFRLVHQHMDNHLYNQARQGLQEILKIDPGETKAKGLLAEVGRREQEFVANRNQREQLYQSAMQAYQGGEISSALSKLERILELSRTVPSSASPERDAQYQSFYNQVRSERESYRNGYAEGQKHLADRNFHTALEVCGQFLQRHPGDPLFQALKLDVEEQQRQEQSAFVGEVNRRVEAEADLDRKFSILSEAGERFPNEPHFQQSLRLMRERRDLVNAIVAKARQYEQRGQFADALGQWDILRSIYGVYPGLDFEVQRLLRRREGQARDEAKARWVEQIDHVLESGDYARAQELTRNALAEFPDDRELTGLDRLACQGLERSREAQGWLEEGQRLCSERQFTDGLEALKKAGELDGKNPMIRAALLNALLEQARSLLGQDWRAAEPLIHHALELDPNHPVAMSLRALAEDYGRQEAVEQLVCEARELQAGGDVESALDKVEQGLVSFPNDVRIAQLRSTLRNALPEPRRKAMRDRYLQQLKALVGVIDKTSDADAARALLEQSRAVVQRYPEDADFRAVAAGIEGRLQAAEKQGGSVPGGGGAQRAMTGPAAPTETIEPGQPVVAAAPPQAEPDKGRPAGPPPVWIAANAWLRNTLREVERQLRRLAEARRSFAPWQWATLGFVPALLMAAYVVTKSHQKPTVVPKVQEFPVELRANTTRVAYILDGQPVAGPVKLRKGLHQVEAAAAGYKTERKDFTLEAGAPTPLQIDFQLVPELLQLRFASDLGTGRVVVDREEPSVLQEGAFTKDDLALGDHILKLLENNRELLSVSFRADPGEPVVLTVPVQVRDVTAVAISSLGARARVYGSGTVKANLKDQPVQPIPADGLLFERLNPGTSELQVYDGKNTRPLAIEPGNTPRLSLWINSDRNVGSLSVRSNVPDATLLLDGVPARRHNLRNGRLNLNLEPKSYRVQVVAPGYENPGEQMAEIHKGETAELKFELKPAVNTASLAIEGGTPEAEVWLENVHAGTLNASGSWTQGNIGPGNHTIQIRKPEFEESAVTRNFTAQQTIRLTGDEAKLRPFGRLDFHVSPANARLTYRLQGEAVTHAARNNQPVSVKTGNYEVVAQAENMPPQTRSFQVLPGRPTPVDLILTAAVVAGKTEVPETSRQPRPKEPPLDPAMWRSAEDGWWIHSGQGLAWLKSNLGIYDVEIRKQAGKKMKKVEWVIDYKDEANQIYYSLDDKNLSRKVIVGGKSMGEPKQSFHPDAATASVRIQMEITPSRITVRSGDGTDLDVFTRINGNGELGKFGFKGNVEVKISQR